MAPRHLSGRGSERSRLKYVELYFQEQLSGFEFQAARVKRSRNDFHSVLLPPLQLEHALFYELYSGVDSCEGAPVGLAVFDDDLIDDGVEKMKCD